MNDQQMMIANPAATLMPAMSVKQAVERYQGLVGFVKELMHEGTDFGTVPGTDKPTLLKPGAEKLTTFFGLTKRFQIVEKVEDWIGTEHGGEAFFYYLYRCALYRGDVLMAESDGSANSWEAKYRWRWVREDEIPPQLNKSLLKVRKSSISEMKFAVEKAETSGKYGKPAEYWQKFNDAIADGTAKLITKQVRDGREFAAWEIETVLYRIPNDDIASQINTLQKMAQKRALIAASLLAVNASEFFTQDIEDMVIEAEFTSTEVKPVSQNEEKKSEEKKSDGGNGKRSQQKAPAGGKPQSADDDQATVFWTRAYAAGVKKEDAQPIADLAIKGDITWAEAMARLP